MTDGKQHLLGELDGRRQDFVPIQLRENLTWGTMADSRKPKLKIFQHTVMRDISSKESTLPFERALQFESNYLQKIIRYDETFD
jgi:hypothetical protein